MGLTWFERALRINRQRETKKGFGVSWRHIVGKWDMAGKTISSKITHTVTLGSGGYTSPLTISSTGTIDPSTGSAIGLYLPSNIANAVIFNDGLIDGAIAATGHGGGDAVVLKGSAATLTNADFIEGGYGGSTGNTGYGLTGGDGVDVFAADSITNTGLIVGGGGGGGYSAGGLGGTGVLVYGAGATLTNTNNGGFIVGIIGGAGGGSYYDGGKGGIGVYLGAGAVTNNSFIQGGAGGYELAGSRPGYGGGGFGVLVEAGALTNGTKGSIKGGTGGQAKAKAEYAGNGGVGVGLYHGTLNNLGNITGGIGGAVYHTSIANGKGGVGGIGLSADNTGTSLSNAGTIIGGLGGYGNAKGGAGGTGAGLYDGATMTNTGLIIGGAGAAAGSKGEGAGNGGYGVVVKYATLSNAGMILGGAGGAGGKGDGYIAGDNGGGAYIGGGTLINTGTITGGNGAIGVDTRYATVNNFGRIAGGADGGEGMAIGVSNVMNAGTIAGATGATQLYQGGGGGYGVFMFGGSTLTNSKFIAGGAGGYGQYYNLQTGQGGNGGTGVYINGAVLINAGTVAGGAAGDGDGGSYGAFGNAVVFGGAGTLVVENGAVFIGDVVANASYDDVLELTGASSIALSGIGTQFDNFTDIDFASGAAWTVTGDAAGFGAATIGGFAAGDTIVVDGIDQTGFGFTGSAIYLYSAAPSTKIALGTSISGDLLVTTDGTNSTLSVATGISGVTLTSGQGEVVTQHGTAGTISVMSGGVILADFGGKITSTTIGKDGAAEAISGGAIYHTVVDDHGFFYVAHGGSATSTTIKKGGLGDVFSGGISSDTTIDGGTLELTASGGVAGTLKFKGKGGVLEIDQTEIPTTVISGFKAGDKVELQDAASDEGTVTVTKAGVVTISADGKTYKLNIAGAKVGATNYKFSGYALTETKTKMAIQRPLETAAAAPAAHELPALVTAGGYQAMAAMPVAHNQWRASAATYAAPVHDLIQVRHGGIQTMVTLQAG